MKKTLLCLVGALLLASPRGASADVSVDFFYNNLAGGSWIEVSDYGYCWQPDVAVSTTSWRPYADGYWAYTDLGWTWVSYEDFGWATYHYGRWARLSDYGWVWVPGRDRDLEWGPAWVSWRTGGQYIGWAPLPPETIGVVESGPITGQIDVQFNIGPAYYNFVDVRYIGEPVLRERIYAPAQNVTYIQQTVNVTNITYSNNAVYNHGPDINVVNRSSAHQIQRLRLDRQQNVDVTAAAKSGGLTKVQGDRLVVAAPAKVTRSAQQVAPQKIKTKVAAAKVDRGWSAVGDERAQNEFKQRLRNQNAQNVQAAAGTQATQAAAGASPAMTAGSPATTSASPTGAGNTSGTAAANANANANPNENTAQQKQGRGRKQGKGQNLADAAASPGPSPNATGAGAATGASPSDSTAQEGHRGRGGHAQGRNREDSQQPGGATAAGGSAASQPDAGAAGEAASQSQESQGSARQAGRGQGDQPAALSQGGDEQSSPNQATARQDRQGRQIRNRPTQSAPSDVQGQPGGPHRQGRAQGQETGQGGGEQPKGQGQGRGRGQGRGQGESQGQGQGEAPAATPQP